MDNTFGRYQIIKELGRGGMATVFLAKDPRFNRDVAIKVLPSQFLHDPQFRARFEREAQTIATLEHPSIVPVYDFGEENEQPYIVMRYMQGGSLAEKIGAGPLGLGDSAEIIKRLASALDSAHQRGIIHRDLKPGNVLFDQYNNAYLSDFGIAKLSEQTATLTGNAIVGTPAYMSPEQAQGNRDVDARTDVYALGIILFEMLTGDVPYGGNTPVKQLMQHIMDPIPRILERKGSLPTAIEPVLDQALSKEPDTRYSSTVALALALDAVVSGDQPASTNTLVGGNQTLMDAAPVIAGASQTLVESSPTPPPVTPVGATLVEADSGTAAPVAGPISYTPITNSGTSTVAEPQKKRPAWLWLLLGVVAVAAIGGGILASGILTGPDPIAEVTVSPETPPTDQPEVVPVTDVPADPTVIPEGEPTVAPIDTPTEVPETPPTDVPEQAAFVTPGAFGDGGSLIAFQTQQGGGTWNIGVMNLDGSNRQIVTDEDANDMRPRWSPDGQWLTFRSDFNGNEDIWMMRPDGSESQPLTSNVLDDHTGSWSPDGTEIAYHADFGSGVASIAIISAEGGEPRRLTSDADGTSFWPSWSPDGQQIVFWTLRNDPLAEIYLMDADGSNQRPLLAGEGAFLDPVWSPVSNEIGYYSWATGRAEIATVNAQTGQITPIDSGISGNNILSDWSPDGDYMLMHTDFHGADEIYRVRVDGSEGSERLTKTGSDDQHPVWQPLNRTAIDLPAETPAEAIEDPTTIGGSLTVWHSFRDALDGEVFGAQLERFVGTHPNVNVEIVLKDSEELLEAFSAETPPDIVFAPIDIGVDLADSTQSPLPLMSAGARGQLHGLDLQRTSFEGKPVGLPYVTKSIILMRNSALIPDAPQSLEDILALDPALIDLERGLYYSGGTLLAQDGQLADRDNQPAFADAAGAAWLSAMTQWNDAVSYGDEDLDAFDAGQVGLVLDASWNIGSAAAAIGRENLAIDPWPDGMSGWVLYDLAYVNDDLAADNEAAAGALLNFLMTDETQSGFTEIGRIPVARNVPIENDLLEQAALASRDGVAFPLVRGLEFYWSPLTEAINAALDDGADPSAVLRAAQERVAEQLR